MPSGSNTSIFILLSISLLACVGCTGTNCAHERVNQSYVEVGSGPHAEFAIRVPDEAESPEPFGRVPANGKAISDNPRYIYDDQGRIISITHSENRLPVVYTYDSKGNRITGGIAESVTSDSSIRASSSIEIPSNGAAR